MLRLKYPERIRVKTFDRALVVRPAFKDARVTDDRHFLGRVAVILKFSLPAGSYATLLIKRLVGPKKTTG
jgi:tRNA(Glu) U13 pseudouridine synthase TruD